MVSASNHPSHIVFIDSTIENYSILRESFQGHAEVVVLDATQDGIAQISQALAQRQQVSSVQILSHGSNGVLQLGRTTLTANNLEDYSDALGSWSAALTEDADILLYGCNVAADPVGQSFVQQLGDLTGADVAASTDLTGAAAQGGDWELEYQVGQVDGAIAPQPEALSAFEGVLDAFQEGNIVVLRTGDGNLYDFGRNVPVFLDEYTTDGTLVQSITLPVVDAGTNRQLTLPNHWDASVDLSENGQYLTLMGFDQQVNNFAGASLQTIALVDGAGVVDTSTWFDGNSSFLGGVTTVDGSQFWATTLDNQAWELHLVPYGSQGTDTTLNAAAFDGRMLDTAGGNLYLTSDDPIWRPVSQVGNGIPTTPTTISVLPGLEDSNVRNAKEFVFLDQSAAVAGVDTLYVAGFRGIYKFSFDGTTWTERGRYQLNANGDWSGLTGQRTTGGQVELFGVENIGADLDDPTRLVRIVDNAAFDAAFNGTGTVLQVASANTRFKGIAFAPTAPTVSITANNTAVEETGAANTSTLTIERSTGFGTMIVEMDIVGTALLNTDYTLTGGTINGTTLRITLAPGQLSTNLTVTATPDSLVEGDETIVFSFAPGGYRVDATNPNATVTILDNRLPVGTNDAFAVDEDETLTIPAANSILNNDTDAENNPLTAILETAVSHGVLTLNANGSFTYTPEPNFNGQDSFTYRANDGYGNSTPITVTLTVNPVQDALVARPDGYTLDEDTTLTVPAVNGVLRNDTDIDSEVLTTVLVDDVDFGTLTLNPNGSFTYTPNANFNGVDEFTYRAVDPPGRFSDPVTVTLAVTPVADRPVAQGDRYAMNQRETLRVNAVNGILGNDTDADNDALSAQLIRPPANGRLTLNRNGSFVYTPNANFSGTDTFTYRASDSGNRSQLTTVAIDVAFQNRAPVVQRPIANQVLQEGDRLSFSVPTQTFVDPDGQALTYSARLSNGQPLPAWLNFNANTGRFFGRPGDGDVGDTRVRVTATDPFGASTSDLFLFRVADTNTAPRIGQSLSNTNATANSNFSFRLPRNAFIDPDVGDVLTYTARLSNGSALPNWLTFNADTRRFFGRPPGNAVGSYTIRVRATDEAGASRANQFIFRVRPGDVTRRPTGDNLILGTQWNDSDSVRGTRGSDRINGLAGDDYIRSFDGNDVLLGRSGEDVLDGGSGNDWLIGGGGDDTLIGNSGADVFVLSRDDRTDQILDFQDGSDRIGLPQELSVADLRMVQRGSTTELYIRNTNQVLAQLPGVAANSLTAADFVAV
jgi:VCBS repeat-containing protein